MDGQLEPVRQDIHNVQEQILRYKQKLAAAEQAGNKEEEISLINLLCSLQEIQNSLQEKNNILLRSQASSKPCLQLVHAYLYSHHFALHSVEKKVMYQVSDEDQHWLHCTALGT